ncbi:hypothetical protein OKA04_12445 [Luteolibacter flavescens]|uniref:DUF2721 domain-containing protein n=1 Tax=Luteolibacter flavescens TaxID=1859460 RepID=A0ABT3FPP2_9BACT|nr:hypothetical protein [Luteolibacter flavescens]MCW1885541.1 hypothetical protein [Luteolibacter flavescens]
MMRIFAAFWLLLPCALGWGGWWIAVNSEELMGVSTAKFLETFAASARTPIFSGFLTMGSFLLAMKTNILARLKESYDTETHRLEFLRRNSFKPRAEWERFYAPLERLSSVLGWNVIACLATSLLQMTMGFWLHPIGFGACVGLAGACLALLTYLTFELMRSHRAWFDTINAKAIDGIDDIPRNGAS